MIHDLVILNAKIVDACDTFQILEETKSTTADTTSAHICTESQNLPYNTQIKCYKCRTVYVPVLYQILHSNSYFAK